MKLILEELETNPPIQFKLTRHNKNGAVSLTARKGYSNSISLLTLYEDGTVYISRYPALLESIGFQTQEDGFIKERNPKI